MAPKAAKALGKAPSKVAGKAPAKPATRGKSPAPPSPPPPPTEDSAKKLPEPADAETLSARQAEELLAGLTPEAVIALAETADEAEQLPARMALEYVGDKDLSWANAQSCLRTGSQLLKEMLDMQAGEFITRQSYQRFQELGCPDLAVLRGKNRAAYVLALFLQACLREARDRLGLEPPPPPPPELPDEPPQWPLVIGFKELPVRISEAARWSRTVLLVCNGHAKEADTFLTYSAYVQIDAKWVMGETMIRKSISIEDMREDLRRRVVNAMKHGLPVHIAMANTAVAFNSTFCAELTFPRSVFNFGMFRGDPEGREPGEYKSIIRESDLEDWPGSFPGRMKDGFYVVVTTDFDLESAREFLPAALPYFDDMAVLEVDPASFT